MWRETITLWTVNRWWFFFGPPIASILVTYVRGAAVSVGSVMSNAVASSAIVFIGTLLLNFLRSPKLLDDDRAGLIREISKQKDALGARLAIMEEDPGIRLSESRRDLVALLLKDFTHEETESLKHILLNEPVAPLTVKSRFGASIVQSMITKAFACELVQPCGNNWVIKPELRNALSSHLLSR